MVMQVGSSREQAGRMYVVRRPCGLVPESQSEYAGY